MARKAITKIFKVSILKKDLCFDYFTGFMSVLVSNCALIIAFSGLQEFEKPNGHMSKVDSKVREADKGGCRGARRG